MTLPAIMLLAAAIALGAAALRSRSRALLLAALANLALANPLQWLPVAGDMGWMTWALLTAAPIAGSALMLVAGWVAWVSTGPPSQAAPGAVDRRSATHAGLRAVILLLVAAMLGVLLSLAPSLVEAEPQALSYAAAAVLLLLVWTAWPVLDAWLARRRV